MDKKKASIIAIIILVIVVVGSSVLIQKTRHVDNITHNEKNTNMNTEENQVNANQTGVAGNGDVVFVHYTGKLTDGKVFDSSIPRQQPFAFILGAGMVIPGWDKGILGMKIGEKKTLTIDPADGYGANGVTNPQTGEVVIPPNATLIFDVELVDIKRQ